jgi:hypothetical protein
VARVSRVRCRGGDRFRAIVIRPNGNRSQFGLWDTYEQALEVAKVRAARGPSLREQRAAEACLITHFYDVTYARQGSTPYHDLVIALLDSALRDLRGRDAGRKAQAQEWIRGSSGCAPAVSFCLCCEMLGLDESATRRALLGAPGRCDGVRMGGGGGESQGRSS